MPDVPSRGSRAVPAQSGTERKVTTRRWRILVERRRRLAHAWTVEEDFLGQWKVKSNGATLTRRGALAQARRCAMGSGMGVFRIDRQEELIVMQESYVPDPDREPAVSASLLEVRL